jgi:hypothetical protein
MHIVTREHGKENRQAFLWLRAEETDEANMERLRRERLDLMLVEVEFSTSRKVTGNRRLALPPSPCHRTPWSWTPISATTSAPLIMMMMMMIGLDDVKDVFVVPEWSYLGRVGIEVLGGVGSQERQRPH